MWFRATAGSPFIGLKVALKLTQIATRPQKRLRAGAPRLDRAAVIVTVNNDLQD